MARLGRAMSTDLRAALARATADVRIAILLFAAAALLLQAIVPTHLIGSAADPLDRQLLASLCHTDIGITSEEVDANASAPDTSVPEQSRDKTCPQCIFCIPGHSLLPPQPGELRLPRSSSPTVLVLRWTPVSETRRDHERPATRAPPPTV